MGAAATGSADRWLAGVGGVLHLASLPVEPPGDGGGLRVDADPLHESRVRAVWSSWQRDTNLQHAGGEAWSETRATFHGHCWEALESAVAELRERVPA